MSGKNSGIEFQAYPPRDTAANQLNLYAKEVKGDKIITTNSGNPVGEKDASLTAGPKGPTLIQDNVLIDELSHFSRERIPERVVHAKGAGAFGYFEVTHDVKKYTALKVFSEIGKKTPVAVRFSQVFGEQGAADTVRDVRGFAVKFYTEDGIWDLVGNNTPIFFIRDAILFPSFIHILKRNPQTHLHDWDMFWDFISLRPETTHQVMILFSDRGIPYSYGNMNGYGSHTFGLVNEQGKYCYCKFHFLTNQGIKNMDANYAVKTAGEDPDYLLRDLYNNIADRKYPSWNLYLQIMTVEEAETYRFNPFDVTKVWLHKDFPLIPVGKLTLNRNPLNYFAEVEQLAFNPADMIPGVTPSPDKMLQGRLFSYGDTSRYRVGPNVLQLPVNSTVKVSNFSRDGYGTIDNQGNAPNYHPNSFGGPKNSTRAKSLDPVYPLHGNAQRYDTGDEDNFTQPRYLYKNVLKPAERVRLAKNIGQSLNVVSEFIQKRAISNFEQVDKDLARDIKANINKKIQRQNIRFTVDDTDLDL